MSSINSSTPAPLWRALDPEEELRRLEMSSLMEFPRAVPIWESLQHPLERRQFLRIMGASFALAGLSSCLRMTPEKIVPWVKNVAGQASTEPTEYASAYLSRGIAEGILVRSYESRPVKIDGNPAHPVTRGGSTAALQAHLLGAYDPERFSEVLHHGEKSVWEDFSKALQNQRSRWRDTHGKGVWIWTDPTTSPSFLRGMRALKQKYPKIQWVQDNPFSYRRTERRVLRELSGRAILTYPELAEVKCLVSLDADFLSPREGSLRLIRDFGERRRSALEKKGMIRLYVAESAPSLTGAQADMRLMIESSGISKLLQEVTEVLRGAPPKRDWVRELVRDLRKFPGKSLLIAGENQPASVHRQIVGLNTELGNVGRGAGFRRDPFADTLELEGTDAQGPFFSELAGGQVEALFILSGNPVHAFSSRVDWRNALSRIPFTAALGEYRNETLSEVEWQLPAPHALETWADGRSEDGTVTLQQPLLVSNGKSKNPCELISEMSGDPRTSQDILRETWPNLDRHLERGFVTQSAYPIDHWRATVSRPSPAPAPASASNPTSNQVEVVVRPSLAIGDGSDAANAWLQEMPDPISREVWGNAAWVSSELAKKFGLLTGQIVRLEIERRLGIEIPILIVPGVAPNTLVLHAGYGRKKGAGVGQGIGVDIYPIFADESRQFLAQLFPTARHEIPVTTQMHQALNATSQGAAFVRTLNYRDFEKAPAMDKSPDEVPATLLPEPDAKRTDTPAWGMTIDLTTCTGCQACVVACQAENNVPVVGREQVRQGREMHWLRVDRYFRGDAAEPQILFQPVPCMHCEHAPCEEVCPTAATVHSPDGLNQMIYNRCVGTRYCSNNCPYKVRRFNFFDYSKLDRSLALSGRNPEVTVRSRGVMEKCTYCIQRIERARIGARMEKRSLRDGEVRTACQVACPTEAIAFGSISDPRSHVSQLKRLTLNYSLLEELGTRPRTSYLARLQNPSEGSTS